jgi:hypothetical protein
MRLYEEKICKTQAYYISHREREIERERERGACTALTICIGLSSAEGQKLECFKSTENNVFTSDMKV